MARNWHFWSFWARPCRLIWCPVGGLVGGCGARAVSRKTLIYFMNFNLCSRGTVNYVYEDKVLGQSWWAMLPCGNASEEEIERASCSKPIKYDEWRARRLDGGAVGLKKALGERNVKSSGHILISCVFY